MTEGKTDEQTDNCNCRVPFLTERVSMKYQQDYFQVSPIFYTQSPHNPIEVDNEPKKRKSDPPPDYDFTVLK